MFSKSLDPAAALAVLLEALESAGLGCSVIVDGPSGTRREYANEALARICGVDIETLRRMPPLDIFTPREYERLEAMRRATLAGEAPEPHVLTTEIARRDGTVVPVELVIGTTRIGQERATFGFFRDVSAKSTMETALRESEELFRLVAEVSPDSITIYANGKYRYANPVAMRHLGIASVEELSRVDPRALLPADRRDEVKGYWARLAAGETISREYRVTTATGGESILESSLALASLGGERAMLAYTRDITERKRLQAELMKQDRLASVGMLAAGVAHELNNPLAALAMQVQKLRDEADAHAFSPEVRRTLEQMQEATARSSAIIADLLFMTRPADKPQAHVDIGQILRSTAALLRAGTPQCPPIEIVFDALPPLHGWASKLGQVFLNVLRNAAQAVEGRPDGTVRVSARVDGEGVEVAIADNGIGVPPGVMKHLTQPFFTTKLHGTGLGLWISHTLVAQHGGRLDVVSEEGKGTTVTVWLPQTLPAP